MGYLHVDIAKMVAEEWDSCGERAPIIPKLMEGIRTGRWDRDYLDAVGQLPRVGPSGWPRHQVASFASVHGYIMTGKVAISQIEVGHVPFPDINRDANAALLSDLPRPFVAYVDPTQCNAPQDGWLEWSEPITVTRSAGVPYCSSGNSDPEPLAIPQIIPPGSVPLEIGSTHPSRTALHLHEDQGVARLCTVIQDEDGGVIGGEHVRV